MTPLLSFDAIANLEIYYVKSLESLLDFLFRQNFLFLHLRGYKFYTISFKRMILNL